MVNFIVSVIMPFTFADEGEYRVRLSKYTALIKIKHVKNTEGVEKTRGMKIHGSPKIIPDDRHGLYYISEVEISIPP